MNDLNHLDYFQTHVDFPHASKTHFSGQTIFNPDSASITHLMDVTLRPASYEEANEGGKWKKRLVQGAGASVFLFQSASC